MLYLIGEKEVNFILDGQTFEELTRRAINTYRDRPGFFTPYKNRYEFIGELIAPGIYPFAGIVTAGFSVYAAALAAVICIGALLVAAGSALFRAPKLSDDALQFAGFMLCFAGVALLTAAVGALLAIISFPHSLVSVVTRSAASINALISGKAIDAPAVYDAAEADANTEECVFRCI
ncbi:hypothetical protein DGG96_14380 [Legionella qingyii]|uniref:Uncharacterized protein n=1 Tax=Legionella qingyii TaxID=2184757 RepID=A0A317U182_9GAMM|nr:hypothetical protein [Legionella qingyii]PWY54985.1 hypothetical protein DGG96_14380 [Legionella qingyii]RUR21024.1 hypothetical protein ELY20_13840 [Legionella qingyii]RUR27885.1 hypothetical protein ELY16_03675 [Legionella qingyii]